MKIIPNNARASRKGPEAWFTGAVWIDEIVVGAPPAQFKANRVSFAPGARTAWHTHPRGQAIHILSGVCRVQLRGQPQQEVGSGDTVWFEPGEEHWHGAAPDRTMVHVAIQETDESGIDVVWLEQVTETEYSVSPK